MKVKLGIISNDFVEIEGYAHFNVNNPDDFVYLLDLIPGDILVIYRPNKGIKGLYTVVESCLDSFSTARNNRILPKSIKIRRIISLNNNHFLEIMSCANDLNMVKYPYDIKTAFNQNLKDIPLEDYDLIKMNLEKKLLEQEMVLSSIT